MKKRLTYALILASALFLPYVGPSWAEEIRTTSPAWAKFTGQNGEGLYFDLLRTVFAPDTIRHVHAPAKRGLVMIRSGNADIYICSSDTTTRLRMAALPMYEGEFHAFFKRRAVVWTGPATIRNRRLTWRLGYYSQRDFQVPILFREVITAEDALKRVLQNGADFYIDDRNLIEETIATYPTPLDAKDYRIESVGFRGYFPLFATNGRGAILLKRYEDGMRTLAKDGKLEPIYAKWGLPMPRVYRQ